jgi:hypothetical protein
MFRLCKILILIWTVICVFGFLYGIHNVSQLQGTGEIDETAANIGAAFGMGFWFLLWFFPVLILAILALIFKPREKGISYSENSELCPDCGKYFTGTPKYCPNCGSKTKYD